jgi:hypothetical protein
MRYVLQSEAKRSQYTISTWASKSLSGSLGADPLFSEPMRLQSDELTAHYTYWLGYGFSCPRNDIPEKGRNASQSEIHDSSADKGRKLTMR